MDRLKDVYNKRYLNGYRENLSGYEYARWTALEHFIKLLKLNNFNIKKVLDYGCGSGLHINLWKKVFPLSDLYFCDISSVALENLIRKYPEFKSRCYEIVQNKTVLENNFYDIVVSIEVMEHVEDLNKYLNDIYRLLNPGGSFIWTTPCANKFSIEYIYNKFTNQIEKTSEGYRRWKWEDPTHIRRLRSNEIKDKLQQVGFTNIEFRFRAHFFSFVCTYVFPYLIRGPFKPLKKFNDKIMILDYLLFRKFSNGASMLGYAKKL